MTLSLMASLLVQVCAGLPGEPPSLALWAWERPEDLRFLSHERGEAEVYFLAATVLVRDTEVRVLPRRQPLVLPPGLEPRPVVRIEVAAGHHLARVQHRSFEHLLETLAGYAHRFGNLQLDFDARASEQPAYEALLVRLRTRAPKARLSMTALASWCDTPEWLRRLPVDEVVPQLFRMGKEGPTHVRRAGHWQAPCNTALGVAIDEPWQTLPLGRKRYVFSPRAWTVDAYARARSRLNLPEPNGPTRAWCRRACEG